MPKGGGAIRGIGEKFSTNPATGTGSLSVPLATSPGRAGFELSLQLSYDSGGGNGPFGVGWNLSVPSVTHKTDQGLPRYAEGDVFVMSGVEDLVPLRVPSGGSATRPDIVTRGAYQVERYRPRTEGLYARIERWVHAANGDVHWRATTKENVLSVYGRTAQARIADPADVRRVFSWLLEETRDDRGNVVRYSYKADDGAGVVAGKVHEAHRFDAQSGQYLTTAQRYLKRIWYGNRAPLYDREAPLSASAEDYLFEVVFDYGEHDAAVPSPSEVAAWPLRADAFSQYRAGFEVRTQRLCRRVLMFHRFAELGPQACLVRSTDFTYDPGPVVTYLVAAEQAGYVRNADGVTYTRAALPALQLGYRRAEIQDRLETVEPSSLEGIRGGVEGTGAQWVDLDGEGLAGVLIPTERAWFYKHNLGGGRLAPPQLLRSLPSPAELGEGGQQLTDLDGDGHLELVSYTPPLAGYFPRTADDGWAPFQALPNLPAIHWDDPNLRFLDLDGDGFPDVLITEDDAFVWYRSRAKDGFEPAVRIAKRGDEREGPRLVFADGSETIQLADLSGDGLVDLVRVRNGEVCYWPNLGYGRFGRRVTLGMAASFDDQAHFDPKRVRFADLDGSGPSDVVYLHRDGVRLFVNHAGNALAAPVHVRALPPIDPLTHVSVTDLLGHGTSCLVWSSPLPSERARPLAYVDLMGGQKPHLLESFVNGLGAETRLAYASSTKFYLQDKAAGKPWLTRLAFPVHVIERVEHYDRIAGSRLVKRMAYHHGYFDGVEREFHGFACTEEWDAETFGDDGSALAPALFAEVDLADEAMRLPPVRTVTWFHTGAWLERETLERELAKSYYQGDRFAPVLPDTLLPSGLSVREQKEAARALRGQILRQEVYAEDGTAKAAHPYSVSERNHQVRLLQRAEGAANAVFCVHPRHTLELHYERDPSDPRMQHQLVLEVDDFGNTTKAAAIGYPRRTPVEPEQAKLWATITESSFANRTDAADWYRAGVPLATATSELTGLSMPSRGYLSVEEVLARAAGATEIPYEAEASASDPAGQRRVIERERRVYLRDDLSAPLPQGQIESRALPHETYKLALTPGLVAQVYAGKLDVAGVEAVLAAEGGYLRDGEGWWAPSGHVVYDAAKFLLPVESVDPFGQRHRVRYDGYALLPTGIVDPLNNHITVGERDTAGRVTSNGNDYRTLAPSLLTDPNRNRTAVSVDPRGMVTAVAVMGKEEDPTGDSLSEPTMRFEYDVLRWQRTHGQEFNFARLCAKEQYGAGNPRVQETYEYYDGLGREALRKSQAEPDPQSGQTRWIGSGRVVYDNKGQPVRQYEPYFSPSHEFDGSSATQVFAESITVLYDPLGRVSGVEHPDGTFEKVVFASWQRETWDRIDTIQGTTWLESKLRAGPRQRRCAALTVALAASPSTSHLDSLGRSFLEIDGSGGSDTETTRICFDVRGWHRSVSDSYGRVVLRQEFDLVGNEIRTVDADAGEYDALGQNRLVPVLLDPGGNLALFDAVGNPLRRWTERGVTGRHLYDECRRSTCIFVQTGSTPEVLVERVVYGELHSESEIRNLRAQIYQCYDSAGVETNRRFDACGNLLERVRSTTRLFRAYPDWSLAAHVEAPAAIEAASAPLLNAEQFLSSASFDALNRLVGWTAPDASQGRRTYNVSGLAESIDIRTEVSGPWRQVLTSCMYNARGQATSATYGNGITAAWEYDIATSRLSRSSLSRATDGQKLRELVYEYDPMGNLVSVDDNAPFGNSSVDGHCFYEYDALYRLVAAEGREHPGQQPSEVSLQLLNLPPSAHPNDWQALVRYRETYAYDRAGNIERIQHTRASSGVPGWTRRYAYSADSNRLLRTSVPGDSDSQLSAAYEYDESGNMRSAPHLQSMYWDHADRLRSAVKQAQDNPGAENAVFYAYDLTGQRVRKVYVHSGLVDETIYLDGYEVVRRRLGSIEADPLEETKQLYVNNSEQRLLSVETKTIERSAPVGTPGVFRYLSSDVVGSVSFELDEVGEPISYEEFHPFGSSAFCAMAARPGFSIKRYRYSGKERDDETGFSYFGARYLASWLGRWINADPSGLADGANRYRYVRNNPLKLVDADGRQSKFAGYVYEISGVFDGKYAHYTGRTIRELEQRLLKDKHKWTDFIYSKNSKITAHQVWATPDPSDPNWRAHATGVAEQDIQDRAKGKSERYNRRFDKEIEIKNKNRSLSPEKVTIYRENLEPKVAKTEVFKRRGESVGAGRASSPGVKGITLRSVSGGVLQIADVILGAYERAADKVEWAPYVLFDEGGRFTVTEGWPYGYNTKKNYVDGPMSGQSVPLNHSQWLEYKREAELLWGTIKYNFHWDAWNHGDFVTPEFVPGLLRRSIPTYHEDQYGYRHEMM